MRKIGLLLAVVFGSYHFLASATGEEVVDDGGWCEVFRPEAGAGRGRRGCVDSAVASLSAATASLAVRGSGDITFADVAELDDRDKSLAKRQITALGMEEMTRVNLLREAKKDLSSTRENFRYAELDSRLGSYLLAYDGRELIGFIKYCYLSCCGCGVSLAHKKFVSEKEMARINCRAFTITPVVHPDYQQRGVYELLIQRLFRKYPRIEKLQVKLLKNDTVIGAALARLGIVLHFSGDEHITTIAIGRHNVNQAAAYYHRSDLPCGPFFDVRVIKGGRNETVYLLSDGDAMVGAMNVVYSYESGCRWYTTTGPCVDAEYRESGVYELLLTVLAENIVGNFSSYEYPSHIRIIDMNMERKLDQDIFERYLRKAGFRKETDREHTLCAPAVTVRSGLGSSHLFCRVTT